MKQFLVFSFLVFSFCSVAAQPQQDLYATAKQLMRDGDYENAALTLYKLLLNDSSNIAAKKDFAIANFYKKDYTKSIETLQQLINAQYDDEQTYQVLGWNYLAAKQYDKCNEVYKAGLQKFPKSGVLHNDYGELNYIEKNSKAAIANWEKGIELEPNYATNYYNAAMYYAQNNNTIWSLIYGEIFINLESYTTKTAEIKLLLADGYKHLLYIKTDDAAIGNNFAKNFAANMGYTNESITATTLTAIRTKFILRWFADDNATKFPFSLFEQQRFLLSQGLFDAYNQWIFGVAINPAQYNVWVNTHTPEATAFKQYQESRLYKNVVGEYYNK